MVISEQQVTLSRAVGTFMKVYCAGFHLHKQQKINRHVEIGQINNHPVLKKSHSIFSQPYFNVPKISEQAESSNSETAKNYQLLQLAFTAKLHPLGALSTWIEPLQAALLLFSNFPVFSTHYKKRW